MCGQCGTPNQNCGCGPDKYSSEITFDGLKFDCSELAGISPNCDDLNDVLDLLATKICELINVKNPFSTKKLFVGAWNMDTTATYTLPHGLTATEFATVVGVDALIVNDLETIFIPLGVGSGTSSNGFLSIDATNVNLERVSGETFDAAGYSSVALNRANVLIKYTKDL